MCIVRTLRPMTYLEMCELTGGGCVYHSDDFSFRILSASCGQTVEVDRIEYVGSFKFGLRKCRTSAQHQAYDYIGFLVR